MDNFLIRKDVYDELIEKGYGKKDYSKLTKKVITDKNGHRRTVFVRNGDQPAEAKQSKVQNGVLDGKRANYEEMLEKVKAGPDENALFVRGEMLNKKDAISYLELKLGRRNGVVAEQKMKMEDEKKNAAVRDSVSRNTSQKMANAEDKAFAESEKDAQKKCGDMSIEELKAEAKKYDGVSKYSPEANEARKVYDILNQKLEEEKKSKDSSKFESEIEKQRYEEGKKGWEDVKAELLPNIKKKVEEKLNYYKKYDPYIMIGKKSGLNAAQKKAVQMNIEQNKENIAFYTGQLEGINERMSENQSSNTKAAENKKEIEQLMKNGFDRRSAYAKVALDEITERLDNEKDSDVRKMLFDDMKDVQMNGLNAKYFEKHKEDYGF